MKRWLIIGLTLAVLAGVLAVCLTPSGRMMAMAVLRREKFVRGRPADFWVERLRAQDRSLFTKKGAEDHEAFDALAECGTSAVPALLRALRDEDPRLRQRAALALSHVGRPAVPDLIRALDDGTPSVRAGAAKALGWMGPDARESIPALGARLHDPETFVARLAGTALQSIGPASVPVLAEALKDQDDGIRLSAAETLERMGPEGRDAVPALAEAVKDPSTSVRLHSTLALTAIGPPASAAVGVLTTVMEHDASVDVRLSAAVALWKIQGRPELALRGLEALARDPLARCRRAAVAALGDIGPPARAAIPTLKHALQDPDGPTRVLAAQSLHRINPPEPYRDGP